MCKHENVTVYNRLVAQETLYMPAEYEWWAECDNCGETIDIDDIGDAEVTDTRMAERVHGVPDEHYD